jgi:ArsR family transcriptional regulator
MMKSASLEQHLELLTVLSDATRLRLCALLSSFELSVVELTQALDLGQSKVSTHLGKLKEQGLVVDRREGTSSYYRMHPTGMTDASRRVWEALLGSLDDATLARDKQRAQRVVEARSKHSWPERRAGELEHHYSPGRTWECLARCFTGLVQAGEVLDIGAGDGTLAEMLAPQMNRYVCLDVSSTLLRAAGRRLARSRNVTLTCADMHALPFAAESFGLVLLVNVLVYAEEPARVLAEAARVVAPAGRLLLVTLAKHEHMEDAAQYGHLQPGFSPPWLKRRLSAAGMQVSHCEVGMREAQRPHYEIITCLAHKA